ncbi:MAG: hypothetical protein M1820_006230 [Bogoriella megaspora]|nr:MAG: hypothetical protein M1820_006230 [Bogoriella megaspora]
MGIASRKNCLQWLATPLSVFTFAALLFAFSIISSSKIPNSLSLPAVPSSSIPESTEPEKRSSLFVQNDDFWNMDAPGDEAWNSILPSNGGFLRDRFENGTQHFFGVTMFHQLHCLQILRSHLVSLEQGKSVSHDHNPHAIDDSTDPHRHWVHCLDYLRQGVTCLADDTIEPAVGDGTEPRVNGWHVVHQCRNSEKIYQMAAAHM